MSVTLHMPRTCANGPNLREVGIRKRQPNRTPLGTLLGERTKCSAWATALSVPGPGTLSLSVSGLGALSLAVLGTGVSWPRSLALCVRPRRFAGARAPGPGAESAWSRHRERRPDTKSARARKRERRARGLTNSAPGCRAPSALRRLLFVSEVRRSLCQGPQHLLRLSAAFFVSGPRHCFVSEPLLYPIRPCLFILI